jgi:hypothetical protein
MMNQSTMEALVERLNHMERENHRWKWFVTVTLAVTAVGLVLGHTTPVRSEVGKVVEAQRFILRDADGNSRAELALVDGISFLLLNDADGKPGVALSVHPDGPRRVSLLDKNGQARSVLTAQVDGDSGLRLFDKNRMHRASLNVMADGRPILRLAPEEKTTPTEHRVRLSKASTVLFPELPSLSL